jgi:cell division protein FtsI (penicillin-binding protein 3)
MLLMATSAGGTGSKAQTMGYSVGGKSGTARKQEGKGYGQQVPLAGSWAWRRWPTPRIVVAVMIDEPGKGSLLWRPGGRAGVQPDRAADACA